MNRKKSDELDEFVNELFKRKTVRAGADDFLTDCNLTRQHIPDEFLSVFFGDQLLSPSKITKITVADLDGIFNKHNSEIKSMANAWVGKQQEPPPGETQLTKTTTTSRNKIEPEIADILREWMSTVISTFGGPFAAGVCEQIKIASEIVMGVLAAAGYAFGGPSTPSTEKYEAVQFSQELEGVYTKVSETLFNDPRMNYRRYPLEKICYIFYPRLSAGISTGSRANVTLKLVQRDHDEMFEKIKKVRDLSATERLFEDFFEAAFLKKGMDPRGLRTLCAPEIQSAKTKLRDFDQAGLKDLTKMFIADFLQKVAKSDEFLSKHLNSQFSNHPQLVDILTVLTSKNVTS